MYIVYIYWRLLQGMKHEILKYVEMFKFCSWYFQCILKYYSPWIRTTKRTCMTLEKKEQPIAQGSVKKFTSPHWLKRLEVYNQKHDLTSLSVIIPFGGRFYIIDPWFQLVLVLIYSTSFSGFSFKYFQFI